MDETIDMGAKTPPTDRIKRPEPPSLGMKLDGQTRLQQHLGRMKRLDAVYGDDGTLVTSLRAYLGTDLTESRGSEMQDTLLRFLIQANTIPRFYVEAGGGDGTTSSTYRLEQWGWSGVLVEPMVPALQQLSLTRSAGLDARALWNSNAVAQAFNTATAHTDMSGLAEVREPIDLPGLAVTVDVDTVTLHECLASWDAPTTIGYVSLDVGGGEPFILQAFDFSAYSVEVFSVVFYSTTAREAVYDLLKSKGYKRFGRDIWSVKEDWYVLETLPVVVSGTSASLLD
jgi:hypothetical protein